MLGRVVSGLRTWMWTMAAPALAASSADWAICAGVTGTAGLRPGVSADPVTAHEIMTLRCILPPWLREFAQQLRVILAASLQRGGDRCPEGSRRGGSARVDRQASGLPALENAQPSVQSLDVEPVHH